MPLILSWIESANDASGPFPVNNLPFGIISTTAQPAHRCAVAIGDNALDLGALEQTGFFDHAAPTGTFAQGRLNAFMALGPRAWREARGLLQDALSTSAPAAKRDQVRACLIPLNKVQLHLPFKVEGFTDFFAGYQHAVNVGTIFRGAEAALSPNWLHIPIAYNGRASSVVVSGTPVRRPLGQLKLSDAPPSFGPSRKLDIELEMGTVIGVQSELGTPIDPEQADDMIFGHVLLNDWSARDIQFWEYRPLGPFQSKAFATTISPWVVTTEALAPFKCQLPDPIEPLLPYLKGVGTLYDIELEVLMRPSQSETFTSIVKTNYNRQYYSAAQQLTHHAIGGCAMQVGDLLGSGTISGPSRAEYGSLLELAWNGTNPLVFGHGITRSFLEDGDSVIIRGSVRADDHTIGFGSCEGTIVPSPKRVGTGITWTS